MRFAISNIAWEAKDDPYMMKVLPEHGVQALEIAPTRIFPETPYHRLPEAGEYAEKLFADTGMPICSMQSIWYRRSESIFGDENEVEALIEYTREAVLFAEKIGCTNLVFGCPKNRIVPDGMSPDDAMPFFRTIGEIAEEHGAVIALEAVPVTYGTNFLNLNSDMFEFVKRVDCEGLRMNLDFGTMLVNGEDPGDIARYVPYVHHVHISEDALTPVQKREAHKVFIRALKDAGYSRYVSIEMRNQGDPEKVLEIVDYVHGVLEEEKAF